MRFVKQAIIKGLAWRGWRLERITKPNAGFYAVSKTCQIQTLSTIYERILGKRNEGMFVEVGAYDGESFSNTSCLADRGWRGVYVEPVPEFAERTRRRHKDNHVTVVECAIGRSVGDLTLTVANALTTGDPQTLEAYRHTDWAVDSLIASREISVPQTTLDQLLAEQNVPEAFDVLVIDTEGFEAEVLAGFTIDRWRPKIIIIELSDYHPDLVHGRETCIALGEMIQSYGYRIVYKDSINTVFASGTH